MKTSSFFSYSKESIKIDTNLSQEDFSKARLTQYLRFPGYIVHSDNESIAFETWHFLETSLTDQNTIEIVGAGFDGVSLYEYFMDDSVSLEKKYATVLKLEKIFAHAYEKNIKLANIGPYFVLINTKDDFLFLPKDYIERCLSKEEDSRYSTLYGCWINNTLSEKEGYCFTTAVYAYFVLYGKMPFPQENTAKRQEDYYDGNFIPLEYVLENCNTLEVQKISNNLRLQRIKNKKSAQAISLPSFEQLQLNTGDTTKNDTSKQLQKYSSTVKRNRFVRKYGFSAVASLVACLVILYIATSTYKTEMNKPTTKGLSAFDVVNTFYTAYNAQNVPLADATIKGKKLQDFITILSGYFINSQMRSSYEADAGSLPINQWFYVKDTTNYWPFGITHLILSDDSQEIMGNVSFDYPVKKDAKIALNEKKGTTKTIFAEYYLIKSEGSRRLIVQKMNDEIELLFTNKKWNIVNYTSRVERIPLSNKNFFTDYDALATEGKTIPEIIEVLRKTYEWLPTKTAVEKGKKELQDRFFYFVQ